MKEYIDKEALLEAIDTERETLLSLAMLGSEHIVVHHARRLIEELPAADVVERKRGEWEHLDNDWFDLWRCTACGDEWTFEYDPTRTDTKVNFCPNCGADMREVDHAD